MMFEQRGSERNQSWSSAIDTSEMAAGRYRLTVTVTDLISGDAVSQNRMFELVRP